MRLSEARARVRAHADVCIDPMCHRLANALEGAEYAEALRLVRAAADPADHDTTGIPPWSAVSKAWPSTFDDED